MAKSFSPIFVATVTPAAIVTKTSAKGTDYALMQGATVQKGDAEPKSLTVMAFGKSHAEVANLLETGTPVELAVQYDGGSLKVIGLPREKPAAAAA